MKKNYTQKSERRQSLFKRESPQSRSNVSGYNQKRPGQFTYSNTASSRTTQQSFFDLVMDKLGFPLQERKKIELLADVAYEREIEIKNQSLQQWWKLHKISATLLPIVNAPQPRGYRSTTKRRVNILSTGMKFTHADGSFTKADVAESLLDPPLHIEIYKTLYDIIGDKKNRDFAQSLNFIILRQSDKEVCCIFNIAEIDAIVVRAAKIIAEKMKKQLPQVQSAFLFFDPSRSDYYLEQEFEAKGSVRIKKLYGFDALRLSHNDVRTLASPFGFMQVNIPMANYIADKVKEIFQPTEEHNLLDLYCGYGLFAFQVGQQCKEVYGIDVAGFSIENAKKCAEFYPKGKFKFYARAITADTIENLLPRNSGRELVVLDPPRSGVSNDIMTAIADRSPEKIVHIFCNIEEIPRSLKTWDDCGYDVEYAIPFDMFAGTPSCEIMVVLQKKI